MVHNYGMIGTSEIPARPIRSFVVRAGRMTAGQQRALAELWPRYGIAVVDWPGVFGRSAPLSVEIGFGNGAHLASRAANEPERNFVGIEVHPPGVGALLLAAADGGLRNLRIIRHDAVEALAVCFAPDSVDEVQILFPDPWHKKRHHKRRLIQPPFAALLASRLRPGGHLHLATDWQPYAEHMLEVLQLCHALENLQPGGGYYTSPRLREATRFENRGARLGHTTRELLYRRIAGSSQ
jgi:tRNA (guanine-N7-)-methyltransferase